MTGINISIIAHKLAVDPKVNPIKQKWRKFTSERNQIINEEVQESSEESYGSISEIPIIVSQYGCVMKKNGKWRVCIDYCDLNKSCPKDLFPLPHIDTMVDATAGHELLKFMDAFSGYNQIKMDPGDQEKTAFIN